MKKLIFFDTETTGRDADDRLCQLAYKTGEESFCELYNPGKKIPPDASAVHHISNKMVASKPAFTESKEYKRIKKLFEDKNNILIAHNAIFDVEMLKKEDINIPNFICTLRVARHLDKEGKIEKYNLQYLRYFLDIEVEAAAHDAMGDVVVMEKLFERLKDRMMAPTEIGVPTEVGKELTEEEVLEKMMDISSRPSLMPTRTPRPTRSTQLSPADGYESRGRRCSGRSRDSRVSRSSRRPATRAARCATTAAPTCTIT